MRCEKPSLASLGRRRRSTRAPPPSTPSPPPRRRSRGQGGPCSPTLLNPPRCTRTAPTPGARRPYHRDPGIRAVRRVIRCLRGNRVIVTWTPTSTRGIAKGRNRTGTSTSRARPPTPGRPAASPARRCRRRPGAAPRPAPGSTARPLLQEEQPEHRQRQHLHDDQEEERRACPRDQKSARSTGAASSPSQMRPSRSGANERERPTQGREHDRDPEHAHRRAGAAGQLCRRARSERARTPPTNTAIAGTTSRPRSSSSRSLRTSARTPARSRRHPARVDPTTRLCEAREPLRLVGGDDGRPARLLEQAAQHLPALGVQPRRRLVQQQRSGSCRPIASERQPLEHPPGELGGPVAAGVRQPDPVERLVDAVVRDPVEGGVELEVLAGREPRVDERVVAGVADGAAGGRRRGEVVARDRDLPDGRSTVASTRRSVVLPAPLGPVTSTVSPSATARSTPARASRSPKRRTSPRSDRLRRGHRPARRPGTPSR